MTADAKMGQLLERIFRLESMVESLFDANADLEREHKLLKHVFEQERPRGCATKPPVLDQESGDWGVSK